MKIQLLDYEAEVEWISPQQAYNSWRPKDTIAVWFRFNEAVASTISFAVDIEAKDYTTQEFTELIKVKGEEALRNIIQKDSDEREKTLNWDKKRKELNKLVADLGDKLAIPYRLNTK